MKINNISILIVTVGVIAVVTGILGNEQIPLAAVSGLVGFLAKDHFSENEVEVIEDDIA